MGGYRRATSARSMNRFLYVTDRKKDLFKTAAGKFVAPQPIENLLKVSPLISNAVLVGDARRFIAALIVPNFANVEVAARAEGRMFASHEQIAADTWVHGLIDKEVDANQFEPRAI